MIKRLVSSRRQKNNLLEQPVDIGYNSKVNFCSIGRYTYIGLNCDFVRAKIGRFCSIAPGVKVISGFHPTQEFVSSHPIFYSDRNPSLLKMNAVFSDGYYFEEQKYADKDYYVVIGSDVWIGADVKILAGVSIGHGAIIAAGAVVVKDVLPFQVVGGVPAKEIKFRFSKAQIQFLLNDKWWEKSDMYIKENYAKFHKITEYMEFVGTSYDL